MSYNIKLMNTNPGLPDDELRSYMNFDALLEKHNVAKAHRAIRWWLLMGGAVMISMITYWYSTTSSTRQASHPLPVEEEQRSEPAENSVLPDEPQLQVNTSADTLSATSSPPKIQQRRSTSKQAPQPKAAPVDEKKEDETLPAYVQAEPVEGYPALYAYFNSNLIYPQEALKDSIQGVLTVVFTINTQGKAENIAVQQSLGEPFEREAIRVIQHMPAWKPATVNNKPVPSRMSIPLTFQIKRMTHRP
jgi:TonB family protein